MTKEEELKFIEAIKENIMPYAQNMTESQIRSLIDSVEKQNPTLPFGFAEMLFQEIMKIKTGKLN